MDLRLSYVIIIIVYQSQIQDFPKEGAPFVPSAKSTRFSVGGGVVAQIFRDLRKPMGFSGGGGSSRNFPWSPKADGIQWGGG